MQVMCIFKKTSLKATLLR